MVSSLIDGWVALIGFGVVSPSKDKKKGEEWRQKWGGFMKIAGLLISAWGAYYIVRRL